MNYYLMENVFQLLQIVLIKFKTIVINVPKDLYYKMVFVTEKLLIVKRIKIINVLLVILIFNWLVLLVIRIF